MSGGFPWFRFTLASSAFVGVGYALMKATTPTEEELYNRMAPDIRRKVDAARALRNAREAETKKHYDAQTEEATKPVWADVPPSK
ncbi:hypothetical protein BDQ17DRAFT_1347999 [Cyathus striatus]|nr:hypothetical protein BDQ17DRAFT_1347999 [Cyathus striatus]